MFLCLGIAYLCAVCLLSSCGTDSKVEQIERGVEKVDNYTQEIEDQAQP